MAYTAPTAADLKTRFPRFADVADAIVDAALAEAARFVDESWTEGDFKLARMLYAAHTMTLDGLGTGYEAEAAASGSTGFTRIKSGSLELSRPDAAAMAVGFDQTTYGQRFKALLRANKGGAIVARADAVSTGSGVDAFLYPPPGS